MNLSLLVKSALAMISGVACWWVAFASPLGDSDTFLSTLGFYTLSGFLFALGVLFPYLRRDRWTVWRGTAFVAVSTLSYWCAMFASARLSSSGVPHVEDFIPASLVGALVVLLGVKLAIPLDNLVRLIVCGIVAAVLGGLAFSIPPLWGTAEDSFVIGYGSWHVLMAAAIHITALRD